MSATHSMDITENWVDARTDTLNRTSRGFNNRDGWELSNSGWNQRARILTTHVRVSSAFGRLTNELLAGHSVVRSGLQSQIAAPLFLVQGDIAKDYLAAGSVKNAQGTETDQRIIELSDNVSWSVGSHLLTAGTQNQFLHIRDNFFLGAWGTWTFASVDSLDRDLPLRYERALPSATKTEGPLSDYSAAQ